MERTIQLFKTLAKDNSKDEQQEYFCSYLPFVLTGILLDSDPPLNLKFNGPSRGRDQVDPNGTRVHQIPPPLSQPVLTLFFLWTHTGKIAGGGPRKPRGNWSAYQGDQ